MFKGISVSNGVAIGKAHLLDRYKVCILKNKILHKNIEPEITRFRDAIEKSKAQLQDVKNRAGQLADKYAIILDTYTLLLEDEILVSDTIENIRSKKINAEWALTLTQEKFTKLFDDINDDYLKGKVDDLDLVVNRVLRNLLGHHQENISEITEPVVIIAHALSPSDTIMMSKSNILGMVTEVGGKTSHVAIFASALGIPAVVGVRDITTKVNSGDTVIVDAIEGTVHVDPDSTQFEHLKTKRKNYQNYENKLLEEKELVAQTIDGHRVQLKANIESNHDIKSVLKFGGEGIGLYRTEFLYLSSPILPSENDLFQDFKQIIDDMSPYSTVIRTLDVGGDKVLQGIEQEPESNPALGLRGIRMSLSNPHVFSVQLRAILRASLFGKVKILYPMVSGLDEIDQANRLLDEAKSKLESQQIPFDEKTEVGVMIETPAAAMLVEDILKNVDFISIGTNDLIQYLLAVDRTNENVAHLYQPFHPAILRTLKHIFEAANACGKEVSICGELGGDPLATMLLLGLGRVDELSMDPHSIPKVKRIIRSISLEEARQFSEIVLGFSSIKDINEFILTEMRTKFPSDFDRNQYFEERTNS